MSMRARSTRRPSRGFSLIEVLTAVIILSVGLLGMAALYTKSLQSGRTALLRTKAVVFASDLADRIRANPGGGGSYAALATDTGTKGNCSDYLDASSAYVAASSCSSSVMALDDIYSWKNMIKNPQSGLPAGVGIVAYNAGTAPPTYTITINWNEANEAFSYTVSFQN